MREDGQQRGRTGAGRHDAGHDDVQAEDSSAWLHGTWQVVRVDGAVLADGLQGPPWLTFDGDGMVYGHAGVNRVRGTWRLDGTALTFGPVAATLMAGPPDATATERAVLAFLQDGGTVSRGPGVATLRGPGGRTAELRRAPAPGDATAPCAGHEVAP